MQGQLPCNRPRLLRGRILPSKTNTTSIFFQAWVIQPSVCPHVSISCRMQRGDGHWSELLTASPEEHRPKIHCLRFDTHMGGSLLRYWCPCRQSLLVPWRGGRLELLKSGFGGEFFLFWRRIADTLASFYPSSSLSSHSCTRKLQNQLF